MAPAAGLDEESLASAPAAVNRPPLLRRRAIIFPSYVTVTQPQVVSQLSLELEQQLPLQLLPPAVIPPREDSWQTNDLETLGKQLRRWLRQSPGLPAAQFILAVTTRKGTSRPCYRVTFFDAQTAAPVGSFSFCRQGRPRERFVPANPQPLVHLVMTSPWWCTVRPGPTEKTVYLTAGLKSGLAAGNRLQLRRPATRVIDPVKKIPLGFAFGAPLAEAVVVDFFGLDGAVANLDRPLARLPAGCLAILAPPAPLNLAAPSTAPGTSPTPAGMAPVPAPPAGTPPPAPGGGQTNNHL
ncbi:MAG: hypothetical protein JRJ56_05645 [Deltaproteobacteria bacterium]|nr:hypothetical protein [Deltaproteobacteria bacterium]